LARLGGIVGEVDFFVVEHAQLNGAAVRLGAFPPEETGWLTH
jgi:hypothetical protein